MRLKWKMLILMLLIAFPAIFIIRLFDTIGMTRLGNEVSSSISQQLTETAEEELEDAVVDQGAVTRRNIQIAESTVYAQKIAIEKALVNERIRARPFRLQARPARMFDLRPQLFLENRQERYLTRSGEYKAISLDYPSYVLAPDVDEDDDAIRTRLKQIDRISEVVRNLYKMDSEVLYWQYAATEEGIHISYPGHGGYPDDYDPRKRTWYIMPKKLAKPSGHHPMKMPVPES